jgi:hypothetical protein
VRVINKVGQRVTCAAEASPWSSSSPWMEGRRRSMEPAAPSLPRAREGETGESKASRMRWRVRGIKLEWGSIYRDGCPTARDCPTGQRAQVGACDREIRLVSVWRWGERVNRRGMQCRAQ